LSGAEPSGERQAGDRGVFLGRLRARLAGGVPENPVHPLPPPIDEVPMVVPVDLDTDDLAGNFARMAERVGATVHRLRSLDQMPDLLMTIVGEQRVAKAVVSADPDAIAVGDLLAALGVEVSRLDVTAAADADLGVTGAALGIAATGSVVQASAVSGARTMSLLPVAHLCIVHERQLVATTRDAIRRIAADERSSNIVLITGPSRSADIEQLLVTGVHGPTRVEIALIAG
jgi:L-lactate dehydrogenase complex protein LldG